MWTIYITNDNCPDYTWGFTEEQTRQAFADVVRGHLDEMRRRDTEEPANRDRYNMAVTQEALCFVERHPDRRYEIIGRIREGSIFVSPFLCNSLWAFQSVEATIRTLYPARRLERDWGIPTDVAEHIEEPSLPWGVASILAGCGVRWLSVPFYKYDSTFDQLETPPLFVHEGPDGSQIRVVMDPWACVKWSYHQGARGVLDNPDLVRDEWLPHYEEMGDAYPLQAILASGTHGDISPDSGSQAAGFADAITEYNRRPDAPVELVNATLPQFCDVVDAAEADTPFLTTLRGCFGHSWDVWPVSLAKYAADTRAGERDFLAAEALLSVAGARPEIHEATRADRERAEWCWAMLGDHAWNGKGEENKRINAELRLQWSEELSRLSGDLLRRAWQGAGLGEGERDLTVFNSLSVPRADLVCIETPADAEIVAADGKALSSQVVEEEEGGRRLCFVSPETAGFGFSEVWLQPRVAGTSASSDLRASPTELESVFYRLRLDTENGGVASLVHRATGRELAVGAAGRSICQTVCFDGEEHTLEGIESEVVAEGPVLARLRVMGEATGIVVSTLITVYAKLDRVDFDVRIDKQVRTDEERLCHVFPVLREGAVLRIDTTGAVIRPRPQPEGDLLPGADTRRFAVQGFVDASLPDGPGVTIAPLDAFVLRGDLDPMTFEALGNDQNYREVVQDQDGVTEFRFRYALRAHAGGYDGAEAFAWSRSVASPLLAARGRVQRERVRDTGITLDPSRAIATCLKPADEGADAGCILRLRETAGQSGPLNVGIEGHARAIRTDLLERDIEELPIADGAVTLDVPGHGFAALRLLAE